MKGINILFVALSVLLFWGCNDKHSKIDKLESEKYVVCRIFNTRIFDVLQRDAETNAITSYRTISERITVYNDHSFDWSFNYTDEDKIYIFQDILPDNVFAALQQSFKYDKRFKLKNGVFELECDPYNSSISYSKGVTKIYEFLTEKYN